MTHQKRFPKLYSSNIKIFPESQNLLGETLALQSPRKKCAFLYDISDQIRNLVLGIFRKWQHFLVHPVYNKKCDCKCHWNLTCMTLGRILLSKWSSRVGMLTSLLNLSSSFSWWKSMDITKLKSNLATYRFKFVRIFPYFILGEIIHILYTVRYTVPKSLQKKHIMASLLAIEQHWKHFNRPIGLLLIFLPGESKKS